MMLAWCVRTRCPDNYYVCKCPSEGEGLDIAKSISWSTAVIWVQLREANLDRRVFDLSTFIRSLQSTVNIYGNTFYWQILVIWIQCGFAFIATGLKWKCNRSSIRKIHWFTSRAETDYSILGILCMWSSDRHIFNSTTANCVRKMRITVCAFAMILGIGLVSCERLGEYIGKC